MTEMNDIHQLIAKHFAGEISDEEMSQLRGWLESSAKNQLLFDDLKQAWQAMEIKSSNADKRRVLNRVKDRIEAEQEKPVRRLFTNSWYKVAASFALVLSLGATAGYQLSEPFSFVNTLGYEVQECDAGKHYNFLLADGTQVYMNGDSRLKYKPDLKGEQRKVYMEGEAFYDVARDESKPFVIEMEGANVKVLGTSFNIKAYPEDKTQETSVLSGKVAFSDSHTDESIHLVPGQKGVIDHAEESLESLDVDNQLDIAWMKNHLNFDNTPLSEMAKTLYRSYGVKFKLTDGSLGDVKITASFENEKLDEVLKVLQMTNEFSCKKEGNTVFIGSKDEF
jgi:ferric-dicitrate binding protein FerR (iron transport regulator)